MLATAKHFPGHGDTATDTHLDLAVIEHPRERLDAVELVPFRAVIAAGIDAVMTTHIRLPALDPTEGLPATLSRPIVSGLLRKELGFDGLVFTDSMSMYAISRRFSNEKAAAMAVAAGSTSSSTRRPRSGPARHPGGGRPRRDPARAARPLGGAPAAGQGRLGLHRARTVDVEAVPAGWGGAPRGGGGGGRVEAITLAKDDRVQVPLRLPTSAACSCCR